ncbi:MAG: imidazole glycerol phosphate synthase subunit HisH [Candidatus Omnitrophica bacterium]|nr:imidazole glycerol phosphate synthase subunit HisH [Candidatus Omnitrophota bacterium]
MISIIDYGMGNLRSVEKALQSAGGTVSVISTPSEIVKADKLVLPGVGAMKPAMDRLSELGLIGPIKDFVAKGKPFLGICLGLQLLFDSSSEGGNVQGLGIVAGTVERFSDSVKVPQMGWNKIRAVQEKCPLFKNVPDGAFVYFCHSYYVKPKNKKVVSALTDYGLEYASAICTDNIWGVQFHPEKSQDVGQGILRNFVAC